MTVAPSTAPKAEPRDRANALKDPAARSVCGLTAVTVPADSREDVASFLARLREAVPAGATVAAAFVFGRLAGLERVVRTLYAGDIPVMGVEGMPCHAGGLAGAQLILAPAGSVSRVRCEGVLLGSAVDDGEGTHCLLAGITSRGIHGAEGLQAHETFEGIQRALWSQGFRMRHVVRTWFYNDRILEWYHEFNSARGLFYGSVPFVLGGPPASTGILGKNVVGTALMAAVWAYRWNGTGRGMVGLVSSPLQCPASDYGSLFSRAAEIVSAGVRRVFVSGTASIAGDGRTLHPGDVRRQIARTLEVVEAILAERRLTLDDAERAIAYFKKPADVPVFDAWLNRRGLGRFPWIALQADVCRGDLLFELELDAVGRA